MMTLTCLWLAATTLAGQTPLDDFTSLQAWSHHPDGGLRSQWGADAEAVRSPPQALRIRYRDAAPHWSNLQRPVRIPPGCTALVFDLYLRHASPGAAMHVWFLEPDGDGWVQRVEVEGRSIDELLPGWYRVEAPLGRSSYEPRGDRRRAFRTADRMLLGCNFGDLDVTVDDLTFLTREGGSMNPPKTEPWMVADGPQGRAAMLRDPGFPATGAASDPNRLGRWLREAGWGVTYVTAGDLTDGERLSRKNFDLLVLAAGASFPAAAMEPFKAFLKAGGRWINLGGYALDRLLAYTPEGWQEESASLTVEEMDAARGASSLNTRLGQPGDTLGLQPDQIGVFDPSYLLQHVVRAQASPGQFIMPSEVEIEGALQGFAAVAMTGSNSPVFPQVYARWIPLMTAYDRFGRERGPVAAMVFNFEGPYQGAAWAFSGVTNRDLLGEEEKRFAFLRVVEHLRRALFLQSLQTNLACYRQGESVWLRVQVTNFGPEAERVRVHLTARPGLPEEGRPEVFRVTREGVVAPGASLPWGAEWEAPRFQSDFYTVEALLEQQGPDGRFQPWDRLESGLVVWSPGILQQGFGIRFLDNYFLDPDGDARFLTGTNQTGMMWFSANENPLVWARDFAAMRDNGFRLLRVLHFSPFAARGYEGQGGHSALELAAEPPAKLCRQTDAIVQLLQKYGIAFFLSLHDWIPVELTDEELTAQRQWAEYWTARYRDVPGMLYDVQNEPSVSLPAHPHVVDLWNRWLLDRYRSREETWRAWRQEGAPPERFDLNALSSEWNDVKAFDLNRFKVFLLNRWIAANREGIKAGDPVAPMTVGYLPSLPPADKLLGTAHVDFSNMHYYGSGRDFLLQFKLTDRRFEGKSLSIGEFGAQIAHDARVRGQTGDPAARSVEWFMALGHAVFGLGGSFIANWDWKEFQDCVFPWGIRRVDLTPKPVAEAYRCLERLLASVSPVYQSPDVFLLVPDSHRLGASWNEVHSAIFHALDLLLQCQVNFGVVNEWALEQGMPPTEALVWPVPYCPDDPTFERVKGWVEAGGTLYLSGDIQFDELRRPTRSGRRAALGLPPAPPRSPLEPLQGLEDPPVIISRVGKGKVFFVRQPLEMRPRPENRAIYLQFLQEAKVERIALEGDAPELVAGTLPLEGGGIVCSLWNSGNRPVTLTWRGPQPVTLTVEQGRTGFAAFDGRQRLRALEGQGEGQVGGQTVIADGPHWILLAEGERDLREGPPWLLLPIEPGTYRFPSFRPQRLEALFREPHGEKPLLLFRTPLAPSGQGWTLEVPEEVARVEVEIR